MLDQPIPERTWYYRIDNQARTVEFSALDSSHKVKLPLRPFLGCLGVAPAGDEARSTIVPEFFGGNMDTPEVRAGSTISFPVNVAGALLYLGDGHAAQVVRGRGAACPREAPGEGVRARVGDRRADDPAADLPPPGTRGY